jgi:hypothetical protein
MKKFLTDKILQCPTDEKEKKLFLEYMVIQNGYVAKSYMVKYLRISSYIRKPFLIYDLATDPI